MSKFSPQILTHSEVKECAKALATMVYRFKPGDYNHFHTAQTIAEYLGGLPNGQLSSVYVDANTLKKALANKGLREALLAKVPGYCIFNRSATSQDVISEGPHAFPKGYQVKVITSRSSVDVSVTFRPEIDMLSDSLTQYYNQHQVLSHLKEKPAPMNNSISPDYFTPLVSNQDRLTDVGTSSSGRISVPDVQDDADKKQGGDQSCLCRSKQRVLRG
jgi:hypothetical protein